MTIQLKSARSQKDVLVARARRSKTKQRLHEASGGATEAFDKFEDKLTRDADLAAAQDEVESDLSGVDPELEELDRMPRYEFEADELLEKLKRKMDDGGE